MALIQPSFLPRSMFDMESWYGPESLGNGPSTLDLFDPFDDLDRLMGKNLSWLTTPSFFGMNQQPKVANKFRVTLDCTGYNPKSIKTEIKNGKLFITGCEGAKHATNDFSMREFRKTFKIPENAETDKLASFLTSNGQLVVEIPLKHDEMKIAKNKGIMDDTLPRIIDTKDGKKLITMNMALPEHIDPSKISITCKDRDLIVKANDKQETKDSSSSVYYYRRTTLPENTDFNSLKCEIDSQNNCLTLNAPLNLEWQPKSNIRTIPIENVNINKKSIN
jgi:HSP20 family molecular chaperone IbpA